MNFLRQVSDYLAAEYTRLGYAPRLTRKGGVLVDLGGSGNAALVMARERTEENKNSKGNLL